VDIENLPDVELGDQVGSEQVENSQVENDHVESKQVESNQVKNDQVQSGEKTGRSAFKVIVGQTTEQGADDEKPIKVYVKRDENGEIVEVNSEIFIDDFSGWEYLDEGFGDRYAHAQSQYFSTQE
jgi:hypothetical protein